MARESQTYPGVDAELGRELLLAIDLARAAGAEAVRIRDGGALGIEMKPGDEPVTLADRAASEMIIAGIAGAFPADPVISEEATPTEEALTARRAWLIDPIDGTKDFIRGWDGFSVMIGLLVAGRPALGVVYQPTLGRTYFATPAGGAHVAVGTTVTPLAVSSIAHAADARLVSSKSHRSDEMDRLKTELGISDEQQIGSIGVKLCLIAAGVRDLYVNPTSRTKAWDTCAPEAILARAGGRLSDVFGAPLVYGAELARTRGLVASNGHVHDEVVGRIGPLFEKLRAP